MKLWHALPKRIDHAVIALYQRTALELARRFYQKYPPRAAQLDWVVGVYEVSSVMANLSQVLPSSCSVMFYKNPYYHFTYGIDLSKRPFASLLRTVYGPILLGKLMSHAKGFIYVAERGFLADKSHGRRYEFAFLKRHGKTVACYFTGSEIRSHMLLENYSKQHDIDVICTYQPRNKQKQQEGRKKALAAAADDYADFIFNPPVDQISYLTRATYPFFYFYPDERFVARPEKYENLSRIRILHASNNVYIKGTPLVHAAIKKLRLEGYQFDYIEMHNVPNAQVLEELSKAHIVLNQFYAFVPSVFGIEAMAAHCAMLTSADSNYEPSLHEGANEAWLVTHYWEIYDNLKSLLDDPTRIRPIADRGFAWAQRYASYSAARAQLEAIFATPPAQRVSLPLIA